MSKFTLSIVTPEGSAYSGEADYVTLPTMEGEIGIYPNHMPVITLVKPGELNVKKGSESIWLAVGEGFAEISQEKVTVLTDSALKEEQIDEKSVETAIARAKEALNQKLSDEDVAATEALIAKSMAQLHLKRRRLG